MNSVFINAIRNMRINDSLIHFELGEDRPGQNGDIESLAAFKATMSKKDFMNLVAFLDSYVKKNFPSVTSNQKETKKSKVTIKNQENNQFKRIKL